jgi:hypothetical protein
VVIDALNTPPRDARQDRLLPVSRFSLAPVAMWSAIRVLATQNLQSYTVPV